MSCYYPGLTRYYICKEGESAQIDVKQYLWRRWNSKVKLRNPFNIVLDMGYSIQMACMPLQTNGVDCGVFVCIVREIYYNQFSLIITSVGCSICSIKYSAHIYPGLYMISFEYMKLCSPIIE